MSKVYVVLHTEHYESSYIVDIYSNIESARKCLNQHVSDYPDLVNLGDDRWEKDYTTAEIIEHDLLD